ncbi:uncharacterized protein LOC131887828 [Tigriopus californicus]|uniref:uncharacterized protein LOC131887828 n=1 Tax=Tigriopus californicus TaxID=6832 RepID=UPI0027DA0A7B|nr:uncharacterized protein LOC131887828 [Tigriopus californicus]
MNHNGQFLPHTNQVPQPPQHFGQHNHGLVQYRGQHYPNQHAGYIAGAGGGYHMASMGSPPSQRADGAIYHQSGPGIVPSGYPAHALPGNVPSMHHRFTGYPTQTGPSTVVQPPQHQYYQHPYTNNYHLHDPKSQISPQPPPQHAMYPQQQHFQPHQQQQQQQHQQPQGHPYSSQESNSHAIYPQNQFRPAIPHGHQHYPAYFQGPQTNPNGYQYGHPQQRAPMQPGTPVMVPNHNSMAANPMCAQQPSNGMVQAAPFTQQHMSSHMRPQMRPRVPGALQVHNYPMHSSQFQSLLTASSMNHMDSQHQHSNMRRLRQMPLGIGGPQLQQMYPQQQEQNTHSEDSQGFSHAFVESHQNQTLDQVNGPSSSNVIETGPGQDVVSSGNYEDIAPQMNLHPEIGTTKQAYLDADGPPDVNSSINDAMDQNMTTLLGTENQDFNTLSQDPHEVMHLPEEAPPNQDNSMMLPIMTESELITSSLEESNTENLPGPTPAVTVPSVIATIDKKFTTTVRVPFGWRRLVLSESVIYYSPSGVQLRSMDDVKTYLLREGTCKCGLECPIRIDESFDFDDTKHSEAQPFVMDSTIPSRYCAHKKLLAGLAALDKTPAFMTRIQHIHNPVISTKRGPRRTKKKVKAFSGMKVAQMLEAREVERQRINEIIKQQKQEYEAQLNHTAVTSTTQAIVSSVATTHVEKPPTQVGKNEDKIAPLLSDDSESQSKASQKTTEAGIDNLEEPAPKESQPPINDNPRQGVSKNLEIRRMSNTEEGNKILNDAWTSPDKDKGQTPLQMVESIVSNINNLPKQESTPQLDRIHPSETTSGMAGGGVKGNSKKKALAHIAPSPSVLGQNQPNTATRALTLMQNPSLTVQAAPLSVQMSTTVQTTTSGVHHHQQQQPVMQLVNTLNGPMIMHAVPFSGANVVHAMAGSQNQLVHPILPAQAQAIPVSTSGLFSNVTKPILKKRQKKKTSEHQQPTPGNTMPIPIIMSTAPALAASPATLTAGGTQQIITIGQASQGAGMMSASHGLGQFLPHQNVMVNQAGQVVTNLGGQMIVSNGGALMTMPTVQTGMVLNQLPDGTFIQVPTTQGMISQLPILHGNCQQILANGGPIIMNSNPTGSNHQIIHSNGGTFILASPGGLVQAQGLASSLQPAGLVSPRQHQQIMLSTPGPSSGYVSPSKSNLSPNTSIKSHNTTPIELGDTSSSEDEEDDDDDDGDEDDADDNDDVEDSKDSSDSESDGIQHQSILPLKQSPSTSGLRRKSPIKLSRPTTPVKSRSPRYGTPSRSRNNSKSSSKRSTPESSKTSPRIFIQSNQVDSSGLKATPPHSACDFESPSTSSSHLHHHHERTKEVHEEDEEPSLDTSGSTDDGKGSRIKRRRKRNAEEILKEEVNLSDEDESDESVNTVSEGPRQFSVGEVIWGAHGNFNSWPGKLIKTFPESRRVRVCWFGTKDVSEVESNALKSLSEGLEAHHRSIKKIRKGRKLNASLERAIQEAMTELD